MGLCFPPEYSLYLILHIQAVYLSYKLQVQFMGIMITKLLGLSSLQKCAYNTLIICKSKCFSTLVAELHQHRHTVTVVTMIFHPIKEIDDLIMKCCNHVGDAVL